MYSLKTEMKFDAAHRLSNYDGKCQMIHGHTYRVIVEVSSKKLNEWGAVIDFGVIKRLMKEKIEGKYDHKLILAKKDSLNKKIASALPKDWIVWMASNPTAENMAEDIYNDLNFYIGGILDSVTIYETETNAATYRKK